MNSRRVIPGIGLAVVLLLLGVQVRQLLRDPTIWPPDDFIEYWAAATLARQGQNPYDPAQLLPLQQGAGRVTNEAVMMWNPPWSLALVLPLGWMPAREAQLLWLLGNLVATGFCGDRLWLLYGGSRERRWAGWLIAMAFLPTLFALHAGQIGPLLLLGAVLFLLAMQQGREFLAGAATVLLAVKPHLAYLVWLAILCDALYRRRGNVLLGGVVAGVVCTLIPLALVPQVLHQYYDAMANRPPDQWVSPTLGTLLRLALGEERFGLQFLPMILGLAWFGPYWVMNRRDWNWRDQTPLLLLVSFATAPYGAWPFDLVLLLPAIVQVALKQETEPVLLPHRATIACLIGINLACLGMNIVGTGSFWFLWVAPAILVVYVLAYYPWNDVTPTLTPVLESSSA